ncbi:MAG: VOC family protein [Proteocatella sp.]
MKYICTLIAVKDIEKSKQFYREVLEQEVVLDFGANVTLSGGFALQSSESWKEFIHKEENEIAYGNNAAELYFEEDDMDKFIDKIDKLNLKYVHKLKEHSWGQRVIRFYDLDGHIIEVGENLAVVAKRFKDGGMSIQEVAVRMDVSLQYVEELLNLKPLF